MIKGIVYTRHDGGVTVTTPTAWIFEWLSRGGFWADQPHGFADRQIASMIGRGVKPDAAHRYAMAMVSGGCTEQDVYSIIRDRDCGHLGGRFELMDRSELPDRWFRNAWKQGGNSGRVYVDLTLARPLQWNHIRQTAAREDRKRSESFEEQRPLSIDWPRIRSAIGRASSVDGLRRVWPEGLPARLLSRNDAVVNWRQGDKQRSAAQ